MGVAAASTEGSKNWVTGVAGAALLVGIYGLIHSVLRLTTSGNLGENDPQIVLSIQQGFQWSYGTGEPPLFEWLALLLSEVFGPTATVFQILRYGLLTVTLVLVYLIARRMLGSAIWALITVEAYALVYQISWRLHEGFTHPMVAMAAAAGLFYAWMLWRERPGVMPAVALFAALTVGWFSNSWFFGFFAALAVAVLSQRSNWLHVRRPVFLVVLAASLVVASPYWLADDAFWNAPAWRMLGDLTDLADAPWTLRFEGLIAGLNRPLWFLSPLLPLLALWFGRDLWRKRADLWFAENKRALLLLRTLVVAAVGLIVLGFGMGFGNYSEHAVMPLFVLGPVLLMLLIRRAEPSARQVSRFLMLCLVLMIAAFAARAANLIILDPVCSRCYFGIPFEGLADTLAEDGADLVIAEDRRLGGNLVAFLPEETDVVAIGWPDERRLEPGETALLIVQNETRLDARLAAAQARFGFEPIEPIRQVIVPWRHAFREDGYRSTLWYVVPGGYAAESGG
ncbi:MAG: ArnT family glycosyltransferase [Cohaesibacteraceae bacterium]